jgi:hypothetical protein
MRITTSFEITSSQIEELMSYAIEGGSTFWCQQILGLPKDYEEPFTLTVTYEDGVKTISNADFKRALQQMADEYPTHFADIMQDEMDGDTGDAFLQLAVLGEITYG